MTDNVRTLTPKPLTHQAFNAFGDVIEVNDEAHNFAINNGFTQRYHDLAKVDVNDVNADNNKGHAIISIFRSTPLVQPITIKMMERHPYGSQAFIPMGQNPYLIVVAPKGDDPTLANSRAFLSNGRQGVNYHKGVWHHPVLALTEQDQFLIVDRGGEGHNCDEVYFDSDRVALLSLIHI